MDASCLLLSDGASCKTCIVCIDFGFLMDVIVFGVFGSSGGVMDGGLQNSEQFDVEVKSGSTRDDATCSTITVRQSRRKNDLSSFTDLHFRKGFVPSPDDLSLSDGESERSSPIPRGVEFSDRVESVEPSRVVSFYGLSVGRNGTRSLLHNLVLDAGVGRCEGAEIDFGGRIGEDGTRRPRMKNGGGCSGCSSVSNEGTSAGGRCAGWSRHGHGKAGGGTDDGEEPDEDEKLCHF